MQSFGEECLESTRSLPLDPVVICGAVWILRFLVKTRAKARFLTLVAGASSSDILQHRLPQMLHLTSGIAATIIEAFIAGYCSWPPTSL